MSSRVGLRLGSQAGFADPRFAGKQDNLPLAAFGSLKEQVEGSEFGGATNDDGANDREIDWNLHDFCLSPAFLCETSVLSLQQFQLFLHLRSADLCVAHGGLDRRNAFHRDMAQVIGHLFQGPASFTCPMRKIMS